MYHSIQIIPDGYGIYKGSGSNRTYRGKNTWDDWHLIPSTRPLFNPPSPKNNFMDIPGANGTVDLSDILSNKYPVYNDRTGTIEFYVMNGYKEWFRAYSDIMNFCHGEKCKLILEDDPAYFYRGRVSVNAWKSEKDWSKIVLDYQVEPFKFELYSSVDRWEWDPFSFIDGIITNGDDWNNGIIVDGTAVEKRIPVQRMPVCPEFTFKCLSNSVTENSKLKIELIREYSANPVRQFVMTTHTWLAPNSQGHEHDLYDVSFYDIVLVAYATRYSWDVDNDRCEMILRFTAPPGEKFQVGATFRRGKL